MKKLLLILFFLLFFIQVSFFLKCENYDLNQRLQQHLYPKLFIQIQGYTPSEERLNEAHNWDLISIRCGACCKFPRISRKQWKNSPKKSLCCYCFLLFCCRCYSWKYSYYKWRFYIWIKR